MSCMRRFMAVLLLLVQLGPLAGTRLCMQPETRAEAECAMPMQGMTHESGGSHSSHSADCAQMVACAPVFAAVSVAPIEVTFTQPSPAVYTAPPSLVLGDQPAPLQPPPIV